MRWNSAEWVLVGLGVATLCLSAVIAAVTATWVIGRGNKASADTAEKKLHELDNVLSARTNQATRDYGEALIAIRAKITETELWNRDNFVTKDAHERLEQSLAEIAKAAALLPAMNVKIDTMWNFQVRRAMSEVPDSGIGTRSSPLTFHADVRAALDPIKNELIAFNKDKLFELDDAAALLEIEREFGERLYELVCKPCSLSHGACLLLACAVARQTDKLEIVLHA